MTEFNQERRDRIADLLRTGQHLNPEEMAELLILVNDSFLPKLVVSPTPLGGYQGTIQECFEEFHRLNPWILSHLTTMTSDLLERGREKIGIGMLWEVLRHQVLLTIDPGSEFKLNNNYRSRYARLMILQNSKLEDVFEIRKLRSP